MPEMTPGRRRSGAWAREAPTRHYGPHNLGGICETCKTPIPAALAGMMETHPTCEPDWPTLVARNPTRKKAP